MVERLCLATYLQLSCGCHADDGAPVIQKGMKMNGRISAQRLSDQHP